MKLTHKTLASVIALALGMSAALPLIASPLLDARGDFLPSYGGPYDPDLDVRVADAVIDRDAGTITFLAILAGPIDRASGKFYVFGVDRGQGEVGRDLVFQGPLGGLPRIGAGVRFDAAVGVLANGQAVFFDALDPVVVPLSGTEIRIAGSEISATLPLSLFPSEGSDIEAYTFNFWPRSQVSLANTTVADFAPDNSNARVRVVGRGCRAPGAERGDGERPASPCPAEPDEDE